MSCLTEKFGVILLLGIAFVGCDDPGYVHTEEVDKLIEENKKQEERNLRKNKIIPEENLTSPNSTDPLNQHRTNPTLPPSTDGNQNNLITPQIPPLNQQPKINDHSKPAETTKVSKLDRWKILRSGLKESAVIKILGEPTSISTGEALSYWYYGAGDQAGRIAMLNLATGKVLWAWQPPQQ